MILRSYILVYFYGAAEQTGSRAVAHVSRAEKPIYFRLREEGGWSHVCEPKKYTPPNRSLGGLLIAKATIGGGSLY